MSDEIKRLGKITQIRFGFGGYQDAQFGLDLHFGGDGWGVAWFEGFWAEPPSGHAQWTLADQDTKFAKVVRKVRDTLRAAHKEHVGELLGVPVELTFDRSGSTLKHWRILTEVL